MLICHSCKMDFSQLQHGVVSVLTWSRQSYTWTLLKLDLSKFVIFISRPLPNKTKPKLDLDFEAC